MSVVTDQLIPPPNSRHPSNLVPGPAWIWYTTPHMTVLRRDMLNPSSGGKVCDVHAGTFVATDTESIARMLEGK